MVPKTQELRPVMVRLPEKLRHWLERKAAANGRSMNTEIIHRLEESAQLNPPDVILRAVIHRLEVLERAVTRLHERIEQGIDKPTEKVEECKP